MKKYFNFINEKLSNKQETYIDLIINYLKKNSNYDLYEYDEEFEVIKKDYPKKLTGKLFLVPETKAVRFNFDRYKLVSIDMWNNFEFTFKTITSKPDYTMKIEISVASLLDDIVAFIDGEFEIIEKLKEEPKIDVKKAAEERVDLNTFKINKKVFDEDIDVFEAIKLYTAQVAWKGSNSLVISGAAGLGKCLGKGTKIIMSNGKLKKVEDIKPGDKIMGPDSLPRNILGINNGVSELYKVYQNKGMNYVVNDEHILSLKKSTNAKNRKLYRKDGDIINIPIKEYLEKSNTWKRNFFGYKVDIEFDKKDVPIEPYFLGVWLGDRTSENTSISTMDFEIENYLSEYSKRLNMISNKYLYKDKNNLEKCPKIKISSEGVNQPNPLLRKMKLLNLIKNKHIPDIYLYNNKQNRLELLAGLIDTDGYTEDIGYGITQKSEILINQIKFLADSLGFKTYLRPIKKGIKCINFEGDYFRLSINGNVDIIPVKIDRKKVCCSKSRIDHKVTGLKIENIGIGEYYGFEIDGDHLFLLEDCTVTHNTTDVENTLNDMRVEYVPVAGDITTSGLYEILFLNRDKLIVFDDMDSVYEDKASINLLKAVLDTKPKRKVSRILKTHFDSFGMTDEQIDTKYRETGKLPKQFEFTGRIIFITNMPGADLDEALISRSLYVDVNPEIDEVIKRIKSIMPKINPAIPIEKKNEIVDFMLAMANKFELRFPLNLRTFVHCLNIRIANDFSVGAENIPMWQKLTKNYLVKK